MAERFMSEKILYRKQRSGTERATWVGWQRKERVAQNGSGMAMWLEEGAGRNRARESAACQYLRSTPMTRPCTWTCAAGTMIGFMAALEGCKRVLSPSR